MSPLDDQLRAALHGRAATLAPASDPLAGIESRARGMKRRRVAASVVGAALAVAAIAVAVPALQTGPSKGAAQVAATPTADAGFDPTSPWAFRGQISDGTLQHFRDELVTRGAGATEGGLTLIPLFGQTHEPSGQEELAFAATDRTGRVAIIGYVTGSESGAEFTNFGPVTDLASFLFVLPGDEVQRLIVVACPTCSVSASGTTLTELAPGVAVGAYEQKVAYVVRDADGAVVGRGSASAPGAPCSVDGGACVNGPANVLDWPTRGAMESDLVAKLPEVYAPTLQTTADKVNSKVLFAGDTDSGVHFVMGQIWAAGDPQAHSFAYAEGGTNGPSVFFGPVTAPTAKVLAFLVDSLPGTTTDLLVVVPHPRTTQVLYDDNGSGDLRPVSDTPGADGVALVDRSRTASADRLQLLTGNGDPATDTTFQGPVATLLCGSKECG